MMKYMMTFENNIPANLESFSFFDWHRQLSTDPRMNMAQSKFKIKNGVEGNGRKWIVLEETAPQPPQTIIATYYIDPSTYLIWRTVSVLQGQSKPFQEAQIKELKINPHLPANAFVLPKSQFIRLLSKA